MGCICCPIADMCSSVLYAFERISMCVAGTAMVCCIMSMLVICLLMGVALGYHFCRTEQLGDYYYEESIYSDSTTEAGRKMIPSVGEKIPKQRNRRDKSNPTVVSITTSFTTLPIQKAKLGTARKNKSSESKSMTTHGVLKMADKHKLNKTLLGLKSTLG